jgi:transposase-like protein
MDETYVKNAPQDRDEDDNDRRGGGHSNKTHTSVVAFKQKVGNVTHVTVDTTSITLGEIIFENIATGSEIHTDEYNSYKHIRKFWNHKTVNHSVEYVTKDGIHTNSVEGFWALLKRGIKGNFHWLSKKHLSSYVLM